MKILVIVFIIAGFAMAGAGVYAQSGQGEIVFFSSKLPAEEAAAAQDHIPVEDLDQFQQYFNHS